MSEELQSELELSDDDQVIETVVEDQSESATDTGENQPAKIEFSPEQQAKVDSIIGDKTYKLREKERENQQLQERLQTIQSQIPAEQRPVVDPMPDSFDDNFEEMAARRDAQLVAAAQFDARVAAEQQQAQRAQVQAQQAAQQKVLESVNAYQDRATKLGIKPDELQQSAQVLNTYGVHPLIGEMILGDDKGPLITTYLGQNPAELEAMQGMTVTQVAVHVAGQIKQRAEKWRPKVDVAPAPVESLNGSGSAPQSRGPKGATYE